MTIYIYTVCLCVWCVQLSPTLYFSLYTYIYYIYIITCNRSLCHLSKHGCANCASVRELLCLLILLNLAY